MERLLAAATAATAAVVLIRARRRRQHQRSQLQSRAVATRSTAISPSTPKGSRSAIADTNTFTEAEERAAWKHERRTRYTAWAKRKSPLYENHRVLAPDGELLCMCNSKKLRWYLARGLATEEPGAGDGAGGERRPRGRRGVHPARPRTIRLAFEPKGRSKRGQEYYLAAKRNRCVACGSGADYVRHYVCPRRYRCHFPAALKERASHDVVLLCVACHTRAAAADDRFAALLRAELGLPAHEDARAASGLVLDAGRKRAITAASTLLRARAGDAATAKAKAAAAAAALAAASGGAAGTAGTAAPEKPIPPTGPPAAAVAGWTHAAATRRERKLARRRKKKIVRLPPARRAALVDEVRTFLAGNSAAVGPMVPADDGSGGGLTDAQLEGVAALSAYVPRPPGEARAAPLGKRVVDAVVARAGGAGGGADASEEERARRRVRALARFVRRWRRHFLATLEPTNLPTAWNVDTPFDAEPRYPSDGGDNGTGAGPPSCKLASAIFPTDSESTT